MIDNVEKCRNNAKCLQKDCEKNYLSFRATNYAALPPLKVLHKFFQLIIGIVYEREQWNVRRKKYSEHRKYN